MLSFRFFLVWLVSIQIFSGGSYSIHDLGNRHKIPDKKGWRILVYENFWVTKRGGSKKFLVAKWKGRYEIFPTLNLRKSTTTKKLLSFIIKKKQVTSDLHLYSICHMYVVVYKKSVIERLFIFVWNLFDLENENIDKSVWCLVSGYLWNYLWNGFLWLYRCIILNVTVNSADLP